MPLDAMLEGTAAFLSHSSEALPMPVFDPAMPADTLQAAVYMLRLNLDHVRRQMQGP